MAATSLTGSCSTKSTMATLGCWPRKNRAPPRSVGCSPSSVGPAVVDDRLVDVRGVVNQSGEHRRYDLAYTHEGWCGRSGVVADHDDERPLRELMDAP